MRGTRSPQHPRTFCVYSPRRGSRTTYYDRHLRDQLGEDEDVARLTLIPQLRGGADMLAGWVPLRAGEQLRLGARVLVTGEATDGKPVARQSPLPSKSDSSQFLSTCSSSPLVFGCSNVAC